MTTNPGWITLALHAEEKMLAQWVRFGSEDMCAAATAELVKRGLIVPKRENMKVKVRSAMKAPKYDASRSTAVNLLMTKANVIRSTNIGSSAFNRLSDALKAILETPVGRIVTNAEISLLDDAVTDLEQKCKYGAKSPAMQAKKKGVKPKRTPRTARRHGTGASAVRGGRSRAA